MSSVDVVVLGAGPAGLGVAYRTSRDGRRVTVVEREQHVGGASASFEVDGVRVDHGSHRLHRAIDPQILDVLRGLLGADLQRRPRRGRIRLAGRWLDFPLTPVATARGLPVGFGVRAALEAATSWARRPRDDTFAEVVRAGLGPTMAERFYAPYARKLWGLDPSDISGEQARRRVGASSPAALLRRVLRGRDPAARTFLYPRRGFGQLWEALAAAASRQGARVLLGRTVTALARHPDGGVLASLDDGTAVHGRHAASTLPLPVLARLWRPAAPAAVRDAAGRLRTRAMVLVYLVLDQPRYTPFDAHYLPEAFTPVTRISEPMNYRDDRGDGDPTDRTVLCAEVPCASGDATWHADDDALAGTVLRALSDCGLPRPRVRATAIRRLASAYPIYDRGFERHLDVVDRWADGLADVTTLGRQGLFVHDNSHHALAMAWAAADALRADGTRDDEVWSAARARFAEHVVED